MNPVTSEILPAGFLPWARLFWTPCAQCKQPDGAVRTTVTFIRKQWRKPFRLRTPFWVAVCTICSKCLCLPIIPRKDSNMSTLRWWRS